MKSCELCKTPATTYCESDQASLCWDCDAKVHGANFLVARHTRCLLCRACQSPTPWKASGARLGNAVSACERCASDTNEEDEESEADNDDDFDTEDDDVDQDDEDEDFEDEDEDEDGDNQVVPWSSSTTPPPDESSVSSENSGTRISCSGTEAFESRNCLSLKRFRENDSDLRFQDEYNRSSTRPKFDSLLTVQTTQYMSDGDVNRGAEQDTPSEDQDQTGSISMEITGSPKGFHGR